MKAIFILEVKKAIQNKLFILSIIIGFVITLLSFYYNIKIYQQSIVEVNSISNSVSYNPQAPVFTSFNHWIGGEPFSLGSAIYFFVFPLLIGMPYGWSYCEEKNSGYQKNLVVISGKRAYFFSKYCAVFFSGGLAMVLPLLLNFILTILFFPSIVPVVIYDIYYGVFGSSLMANLYYTKPFLYVGGYLLIDFVYCGLIACLSLTASSFIRQKWAVAIAPFLFCLVVHLSTRFVYTSSGTLYKQYSPLYFLRPVESGYPASWIIIFLSATTLFLITFLSYMIWECNREIY